MMKSQRSDTEKIIWLKKIKEKALMKFLDKMYKSTTMLNYCLKCKKMAENINPRVSRTSNNETMLLSKCATCGSKKSKFIKEQEVSGLVSNLEIKTALSKILLLSNILFEMM